MDLDSYYRQRVDEMHRVSELHFRRYLFQFEIFKKKKMPNVLSMCAIIKLNRIELMIEMYFIDSILIINAFNSIRFDSILFQSIFFALKKKKGFKFPF